MMLDAYSLGALRTQPARTMLSVGGIAGCVVLMLFLLGVYRGVADGSLEYIRANRTDLWILQRNASNILRCTSVLLPVQAAHVAGIPGVETVAPVLLILATIGREPEAATVYLAGYNPASGLGGPPAIPVGREPAADDEIVLDAAFARKFSYLVGDTVTIRNQHLSVVGISTGTNAFVVQYAFVNLATAQRLVGVPGLATAYLVRLSHGASREAVAPAIRAALPTVAVFDQTTFLANNTREMQAGFLPFIFTISALGLTVLTVVLSLLLSIHILERRRELAVMKALGAPPCFLGLATIKQALMLAGAGGVVALLLFWPVVELVQALAPEVAVDLQTTEALWIVGLVAVTALASALVSMQRLRRIYALEAFA